MQLQIEIMKYTLLKLASKASKCQGDKEQIMKSLCSRVKHGASALCRCISSAAFSHCFHIRQTSWMLLRRPSGRCLSTATCTEFCWVGRGPAQEQKRSSCACLVPMLHHLTVTVQHWGSAQVCHWDRPWQHSPQNSRSCSALLKLPSVSTKGAE